MLFFSSVLYPKRLKSNIAPPRTWHTFLFSLRFFIGNSSSRIHFTFESYHLPSLTTGWHFVLSNDAEDLKEASWTQLVSTAAWYTSKSQSDWTGKDSFLWCNVTNKKGTSAERHVTVMMQIRILFRTRDVLIHRISSIRSFVRRVQPTRCCILSRIQLLDGTHRGPGSGRGKSSTITVLVWR
jgi:hypothetical protein